MVKVSIIVEGGVIDTMKHRPLYVRRKCNQNIMGKDVGFCMVSKRQVATYG